MVENIKYSTDDGILLTNVQFQSLIQLFTRYSQAGLFGQDSYINYCTQVPPSTYPNVEFQKKSYNMQCNDDVNKWIWSARSRRCYDELVIVQWRQDPTRMFEFLIKNYSVIIYNILYLKKTETPAHLSLIRISRPLTVFRLLQTSLISSILFLSFNYLNGVNIHCGL